MKYILFCSVSLYSLFIIFFTTYKHCKKELYFRKLLLNINNSNRVVIHLINPTAGLANTLRGVASTIILSYLCSSKFYLKKWNSVVFYFDFPRKLLYNLNLNSTVIYKRFNITVIKSLNNNNIILTITEIHGFMNVLINLFSTNIRMILLKKKYNIQHVNKNILNSIVYREIFIPSKYINNYLHIFNQKKMNKRVLGIHVRSEKYTINYTNPISLNNILYKFFVLSNKSILQYNISHVFTISDNTIISDELKKYFYKKYISIPFKGDIIHSRYALYNKNINNNAIRIVSEFIILSHCDIIIGTRSSSFSYESCIRLMKKCIFT